MFVSRTSLITWNTVRTPASIVAGRSASAQAATPPKFHPNRWDIWFLGIGIGLGGQYFSWNSGLRAGLYSFLIAYFVVGFAYIALCCCTSEITGALPFAGGAYGLSRCTLGFFAGYVIGCIEALEYITYVSTAVLSLTNMLVEIWPVLRGTQPALALVFYASAMFFHCRGGKVFWRWNVAIGVLSLFFVLLYCIGSFPDVDFANNADPDPELRFIDGLKGFVTEMPLACWFFVGVEALSLASDDVANPRAIIPFAQVSCILVLFCVGIVVFFVTVSLPPPGLYQVSKLLAPFNNGFQLLFHVEQDVATLFSIPAMFATTSGFMWGYGKLIHAMATSKLLPTTLGRTHAQYGTPHFAIMSGSLLSYIICFTTYFRPEVDKYLFNVCIAAAFLGYASQCVGYISLKLNYPNIRSSSFRSPFGMPGAVFSLLVWILGIISVAGFQEHSEVEVSVFVVVVALLSVNYFGYARGRQTFSRQETKIFLVAHVTKLGLKKKRRSNQRVTRLATRWRVKYHPPTGVRKLAAIKEHNAVVFPVDNSTETLRRISRVITPKDDEIMKLPRCDPAKAESPFCHHYCHPVPADPLQPCELCAQHELQPPEPANSGADDVTAIHELPHR